MIYVVVPDRVLNQGPGEYARALCELVPRAKLVLEAELDGLKPGRGDCVLLAAHLPDVFGRLKRKARPARLGVVIHSSWTQLEINFELEQQLIPLAVRAQKGELDFIGITDLRLFESLTSSRSKLRSLFVYLPHWMPFEGARLERRLRPRKSCRVLLIGSEPRWRGYAHRNVMVQLLGAAEARRELDLPLKVYAKSPGDELSLFARLAGAPLRELPRLDHRRYDRFLSSFDVGLSVSLGDSFSYSTAALMLRGIPVLFSSEIQWAHAHPVLRKHLFVEDFGSPAAISRRLVQLVTHARFEEISEACHEAVVQMLKSRKRKVLEAFSALEHV